MRIKKVEDGNEYIRAGDLWVRNFTNQCRVPRLLDSLVATKDRQLILGNQQENLRQKRQFLFEENAALNKVVIVSDGYAFREKQHLLAELPLDVGIFAVNSVLPKWTLLTAETPRPVNLYVVNNPYDECMGYMPLKERPYFPACVASLRTCNRFVRKYEGQMYFYEPTPEVGFGFKRRSSTLVDDYRNPICAAIDIAFHIGVQQIMLFCCDDSFAEQRDASVQLENGLYTYPHHLRCQDIIDAKLFWLNRFEDREIKVADYSKGRKYLNASYIEADEQVVEFFK